MRARRDGADHHSDRPRRAAPAAHTGATRDVLEDLARPVPAPDLTRSIMGRLGYMRVPDAVSRRRRRRMIARRVLMGLTAAAVIGLGLVAHEQGPSVRRATGPTIPSALRQDVSHHQQRLERAFRTIRELAPALAPADERRDDGWPPIDEDVDRSAVGPVRWL